MFRYASTSWAGPTTRMRRSTSTGGIAAPLPSKTTTSGSRAAASRAPASTFEVNTAPASPPPARRQPIVVTPQRSARLEMVGSRMTAGTPERDQVGDLGRLLDHLGLARPSAAHRDDDDVAVAGEQPREMPGDGGLADALAGADDGDRRQLERLELRRIEAEVGADVREPGRERARGPAKPLGRPEHGLVGEVDDELGARRSRRRAARRSRHRHAASPCLRP